MNLRPGIRAGLPLSPAVFLVAMTFGVLAEPVMGSVAPIVMSIVVYAGSSQFAALAALAAGAAAPTAILGGLLMNLRFLAMGFAVAPSLTGRPLVRALKGQTVVDASFAIGNEGAGRFDEPRLLGSTIPQFVPWVGGTIAGVFAGSLLGDIEKLGLDAMFPAFFLALMAHEVRNGRAIVVALEARRPEAIRAVAPVARGRSRAGPKGGRDLDQLRLPLLGCSRLFDLVQIGVPVPASRSLFPMRSRAPTTFRPHRQFQYRSLPQSREAVAQMTRPSGNAKRTLTA